MSRAFVKEDGDWYFCLRAMDACMFADENGRCLAGSCKNPAHMTSLNQPEASAKDASNRPEPESKA